MENKESINAVKLGAFVLGGVALFILSIFYVGRENSIFNKTFTVSAVFRNIEGLQPGDNVWLSGVKIGTVKAVNIIAEGRVVVNLNLKDKQNQFIKKDATAFIGSDGLVGNKIVVIRPGVSKPVIQDHDTINSLSPTDTQDLINIAKEVGANTRSLTDDLKLIAAKINKGEGFVGEMLHEGKLSDDLRSTIASLKQAGENTNRATNQLNTLLTQVNHGNGLVTRLLTDTSYVKTFDAALRNVAKVGENSKILSADLKDIIAKMNTSNNAIGVLLTDSAFAGKLKHTLDNARSASAKLDQDMEALQHNFLLRGYFKKQKKAAEKAARKTE